MAKKEKHVIEVKYLDLKKRFKAGEMSIEEVDQITCELIADLAILTEKNVTEIGGTSIDLYKNRVWYIIELAGLLPEYRDEDEDVVDDVKDDYYNADDEDSFDIDDSKFYR